ncbi:MAG: aminotransferase class V-fold PLP-dependent enzyme [Stygiobacter sp.]|uniref:Aminotransferase class V-fold PLP-dependent enzyme n=1 Tax=Stygiobacter electus TaxID=3032292 RepID=A0AAE3P1Q6_9BACT|nr:aminotransferase class V-fold PLP-dependent enzyme [Stygiobacter electus]MDF1612709.1 aminotransferase class V-fold PLP-dependent enzyme [Stygiobacter electus]
MDKKKVRELFPHLKTEQIYFNHAAIGPWSDLVLKRLEEYKNLRIGEMINPFPYFLEKSISAKKKLSQLINCSPDRIAWIDNVSNGISLLANSLQWKVGDEVILNDIEFPANVYPFLNLKSKGVEVKFAKSKNGIVDFDDIVSLVTNKTKLISISYVQFLTGYNAKIDEIGNYCKTKNIIFCVDAIQATGVLNIDVQKSNIDFLIGGTQKWLMTSQGLSYFFITEELQNRLVQESVGWLSVKNENDFLNYKLDLKDTAERFQNGTVNSLAVCLFDASLDLFIETGISYIQNEVRNNSSYLIKKLSEIGVHPILHNVDENHLSGIVSFQHKNNNELFEKLILRKIICAMREGYIRLSPHFYNTKDEIDFVVNEIKECLK